MPTELNITAQTTFSQIYEKFGNSEKEDFSMRFKQSKDGLEGMGTLYTKGKLQMDGVGQKAAEKRMNQKEAALGIIKSGLSNQYGEDFALKVMVRLDKDQGLNLNGGVLRRGDMDRIQRAVNELQVEMVAAPKRGGTSPDTIKSDLFTLVEKHHSDPKFDAQAFRKGIHDGNAPNRMRVILSSGDFTHESLRGDMEKHMIDKLTPKNTDGTRNTEGMTAKEIRQQDREIQAVAKEIVAGALTEIYDELGLVPHDGPFTLNKKGLDRLEDLLPAPYIGKLTQAEVSALAQFNDDPAGLKDHLEGNPQVAFKLLTTPLLENHFKMGASQPGFDAANFMEQLATATGFQLDDKGFHCTADQLKAIMKPAQNSEGIKPDLAYRVAVRLQASTKFEGRIGGPELVKVFTEVCKSDPYDVQKTSSDLGPLSQVDMGKVQSRLGSGVNLGQLIKGDRNLMIKLATCHPNELKGHLALIDRGGLTVDQAYDRILSHLPGHDAQMNQDGILDTLTVGDTTYKKKPGSFGDEAGFGEIMLMEKQGNGTGDDRIVLKKVKLNPKATPEQREEAWKMLSNEIRLHAHISDGSDKVVKLLDPVRIGDDLYMAMECCDLGSLNKAVREDGVGKIAKQMNMEPKVELALKLSYLHGMLGAMSDLDDLDVIHHDNKEGNYFMTKDGDIVAADFGTACKGPASENIFAVDNAEQQSPETATHRMGKSQGPPYGQVTTKSDSFAFGVAYVRFISGHDMFTKDKFAFDDEKELVLRALYEHRDGFFMPPEPQMPNPPVGPAKTKYDADLKEYNRMAEQKKFVELAGFTIHDDGRILMFPDDGNPLHTLGNNLLSGDPAKRASAKQALNSQAMMALDDPVLQGALKEMRSIMGNIDTGKTVKLNEGTSREVDTGVYQISPQQEKRLAELSQQVKVQIGSQEVWDDMIGG